MFPFLFAVVSVLVVLPASSVAVSYTALKFADDAYSLISYNPDMTRLADKFSICLWVKKQRSENSPCPFAYKSFEIFMTDTGYYNRLFSSTALDGALTSKFTVPMNTWYNYCSTWSLASRTFRVYLNGQQVGTQTTPSGRRLQTGGTLVLGNYGAGSGHQFGGQMFNFNLFSRELTATEVASMSESGLCTEIPEELEAYRVIKWEEILKLSRSGTVEDFVDPKCAAAAAAAAAAAKELRTCPITLKKLELAVAEKSSLELSLNKTQGELLKLERLFNSTQEELVGVKRDLERTEGELNETKSELEDTKSDLKNLTESRCELVKGNLTKWDIFYSPPYYKKTFTRSLYQQLRVTWDSISSRLFGMTITDKLIELIKDLEEEQGESCQELIDLGTGES